MRDGIDLLIFGAHPDDAEIGMGATIAKHVKAGLKVAICDLTEAELSSNGTVETRRIEAEKASSILGLWERSNLQLPDRGLTMDLDIIKKITAEIRRLRPRIVFAPYWQDRHPDHVMCCKLVQEAVFNARLRKYLPELPIVKLEAFYFYFINDVYEPDFTVDVSSVYEQKTLSLRAYETQFEHKPNQDFVATPINQGYLERVEARDRLLGQQLNVGYAEGFVSKQPMMVELF